MVVPKEKQRSPFALGVDLGGHNLRGAVIDGEGRLLHRKRVATDESRDLSKVLDQIAQLCEDLCEEVSGSVIGVGIGVPGFMDHESGFLTSSPNFPTWNRVNLHEHLNAKCSLPFLTENDANMAALGEFWKGAGKGAKVMVCLTLGTGVGGAVVQEGKLLKGAHGLAGELGHIVIDPQGPVCGCGAKGCLEAFASGSYIERRTGSASRDVYDRAMKGDDASRTIFEEFGCSLGLGVSSLVQVFDPSLVVIGGQVSQAWEVFYPSLLQEFSERLSKHPGRNTPIIRAACGDDAGLLGAAYRVFETYGESGTKNR